MSQHTPTPKHRKAPKRPVVDAQKKAMRTTVLLSTLAVAGTGTAVAGGVAVSPTSGDQTDEGTTAAAAGLPEVAADDTGKLDAEALQDRADATSRSSDRREATDPTKAAALDAVADRGKAAQTASEDVLDDDPRTIASAMMADWGWDASEFECLDSLWTKESGWSVTADNPSSSAYGIPQALPGSKMASAGADWATNPATQIEWGLGYIEDRYGSPCGAWSHSMANNWY